MYTNNNNSNSQRPAIAIATSQSLIQASMLACTYVPHTYMCRYVCMFACVFYVCICIYVWDMYLNTIFHANGRVGGWIAAVFSYCCCWLFAIACRLLLLSLLAFVFYCSSSFFLLYTMLTFFLLPFCIVWQTCTDASSAAAKQTHTHTYINMVCVWMYLRDTCTFAKLVACDTFSVLMCTTAAFGEFNFYTNLCIPSKYVCRYVNVYACKHIWSCVSLTYRLTCESLHFCAAKPQL